MYIRARLIPDGTRTPMKRTLFPNIAERELGNHTRLIALASKKIPVNATELEVEANGPIELLLAVVSFCHTHDISLYVTLPEDEDDPNLDTEDVHKTILRYDYCPTCEGRFSSSFNHSCPFCGGWGYEPYLENDRIRYDAYMKKDKESEE